MLSFQQVNSKLLNAQIINICSVVGCSAAVMNGRERCAISFCLRLRWCRRKKNIHTSHQRHHHTTGCPVSLPVAPQMAIRHNATQSAMRREKMVLLRAIQQQPPHFGNWAILARSKRFALIYTRKNLTPENNRNNLCTTPLPSPSPPGHSKCSFSRRHYPESILVI